MSQHGATLQTYNQELVKCLEDLKERRNEVSEIINKEESDKALLEKNIKTLQEKLSIISGSLAHHKALKDSYDQTIKDTETGFKKILESSQTLLNLAQHEANKLDTTQKHKSLAFKR